MEPLSKRVEVTLRTSSAASAPKSNSNNLNQIMVGDIIHGKVKRVESYGLFISIDQTNVVSELVSFDLLSSIFQLLGLYTFRYNV